MTDSVPNLMVSSGTSPSCSIKHGKPNNEYNHVRCPRQADVLNTNKMYPYDPKMFQFAKVDQRK